MTDLYWLPELPDWRDRLRSLVACASPWDEAVALANARVNFVLTNGLDQTVARIFAATPPIHTGKPVKLAVLASCTTTHLLAAIRVAGLRRGIRIETYENGFGQYLQELSDPLSGLHAFQPTAILFVFDAYHVCSGITAGLGREAAAAEMTVIQNRIRGCWQLARDAFRCPILQQTIMPVHPSLLGNNEHRLPGSRADFAARLNVALREMADAEGVELVALDRRVATEGLARWHDTALWHRSKQEILPSAAPLYGDLVVRLLAAKLGKSFKCLVLDLDNTLWGGVVGDDGVEGIVIGQGSPLGEAHAAFQQYALELSRRGVILAVCSKNNEANALEPFDRHPEMVLKRGDIACFVANWSDKAANIRAIAEALNIGLDSLVFVDDNPFERNLVRRELPMVAVPEVGEDPAHFARTVSDAGYFEGVAVTDDDRERAGQYQGNLAREALKSSATDLESYLRDLDMRLIWRRFDKVGLQRIVQLINKSNQFNLTTRRYTEDQVLAAMDDPSALTLQLRLTDRFGDNGIIAIIIGRLRDGADLYLDTWLMSCRVLGRQVEATTLNLIAAEAARMGARRLVGEYTPTAKNAMVKEHYVRLGFARTGSDETGGNLNVLELDSFAPADTFITTTQDDRDGDRS